MEIYDQSLMSLLNIPGAVKGKRILEFGAGGMSSSFDMVSAGAETVYVLEHNPFALSHWKPEELDELLRMKAECKEVDRSKVVVEERYVGGEDKSSLSQSFDQSYFFFPNVVLVGKYPGGKDDPERRRVFEEIVEFAYSHLVDGGQFMVVTEMDAPYIHEVLIDGFERTFERLPGSERRIDNRKRIRPVSSLALTVLKYEKVS